MSVYPQDPIYRVTFALWDEGTEEWRGEETHEVRASAPELAVGTALFAARHNGRTGRRAAPPIESYKVTRVVRKGCLE